MARTQRRDTSWSWHPDSWCPSKTPTMGSCLGNMAVQGLSPGMVFQNQALQGHNSRPELGGGVESLQSAQGKIATKK